MHPPLPTKEVLTKKKHALMLITVSLLLAMALPLAAPAHTDAPTDPDALQAIESFVEYANAMGLPDKNSAPTPAVDAHPQGTRYGQWCNTAPIVIPELGAATPYPSTIQISWYQGVTVWVRVHLLELTHSFPSDIDILLVGPQGQNLVLMSQAGGGQSVSDIDLIFDDRAADPLPFAQPIASGTYRPTSYRNKPFPPPAPESSGETALSIFEGISPHGTWELYVADRHEHDAGQIAGGWCLEVFEPAPRLVVEPTELRQPFSPQQQTMVPLTLANEGHTDLHWALTHSPATDAPQGSPIYYHSRNTFDKAFPGLPVEDFEAGRWEGQQLWCPAPFNALTDNECFQPGDILPGVSFQDNPLNDAEGGNPYGLVGNNGYAGALSRNIVAATAPEAFEMLFDPPVNAAGMDLVHYYTDGAVVDITIYDADDVEIAATQAIGSNAGYFWGVYSPIPIGRIHIHSTLGDSDGWEGVDNVAFGQVGASCSTPEEIPWLTVSSTGGVLPIREGVSLDVTMDRTGLALATYTATLCISSDAPTRPLWEIPVTLNEPLHVLRLPITAR